MIVFRNDQIPIAPQHVLGPVRNDLFLVGGPPDAHVVDEVADALVEGAKGLVDLFAHRAQGAAAAMTGLFDGA